MGWNLDTGGIRAVFLLSTGLELKETEELHSAPPD